MPVKRLFFALWPDDEVRAALAALWQRHTVQRGKPVRPENLHITLVFLGPVDDERRSCLESAAGELGGEPFTLVLDQLSWWSRPRVMWVGPSQMAPALPSLVGDLKLACEGCGFEPERRPYRAHMTLARKVPHARVPPQIEPIAWHVGSFALVESKTLPAGAEYSVLRTWALGSGS